MADLSVTHDFVDGTPAEADEVDQNFSDVVTWVNANAIRKDASVAFTGVPSGPSTNPTSDNQFTRKGYVDNLIATPYSSGIVDSPQTQPATNNQILFDGGSSAVIIPDLGYTIEVWGSAFCALTPSVENNPLNLWELTVEIDGTVRGALRIPVICNGQSMGVEVRKVNLAAGSHTVRLFTENVGGTGYTADVASTSTTRTYVEMWVRRRF